MRFIRYAAGVSLAAALAFGQAPSDIQQQIDQLRQQIDQLEQAQKVAARQKELADEDASAKAKNAAAVTADTSGFTIRSNDGNFLLKVGADIQIDSRSPFGEGSSGLSDTILLRRVRPTFSGTIYHYVDYFIRPDFGGGQTIIYDAYAELKYFSRFKLRVGKFKPPVGLERLQSDDDTSFVERGLPTLLVPSRDIGFQLSGDFVKGRVGYQIGVFNGVPDNGLSDAAASIHRDYAARIFLTPFAPDNESPLRGLGFGIGTTSGNVDGEALPSYKTFGQNSFLPFASGVSEAGHRTRLAPQAYYYAGPFGLYTEYGLTQEGLQKGNARTNVGFRAWQVQASYILTGEHKSFASPTPKHSFDPANGGWGAWEIAVRTGGFSADQALFADGFASPTAAARVVRERVASLNWYLNRLFRVSLDYGNSVFGGGGTAATGGNRPEEKVVILRFQINFI
ncbi:MAG TPA: porin [Bryobacteraceae bacterium]|nr:porin [Bryobacteraceae bacterium]